MTDPTQAGQPSEEELRAYLDQLRTADPAEILVQAYRLLGTGAEVKLGRPDARVLIDAMNGMIDGAGERLPDDLAGQMRDGVRQLQMAQVQTERQAQGEPASEGAGAAGEPGEAAGATAGQPAGADAGQRGEPGEPPGPPGDQRLTDRLWIPGRDPRPR